VRPYKLLPCLLLVASLASCAAAMTSSHKTDGYVGTIDDVAVYVVDFGPTSKAFFDATSHSSTFGNALLASNMRSKASSSTVDGAHDLMVALRDTLPGLMAQSGLHPTFYIIEKGDTHLSINDPNRKAIVIQMTGIRSDCNGVGCTTRVTLKTEVFDPKLQKSVWDAEASVGQTSIFDGPIGADNVRAYWKLIYDKLKQDGLVA